MADGELSDHVTALQLDITDPDAIKDVFDMISSRTSGLDAIIHTAGILRIGSLVELPVSDLEETLHVNLLGIYRINKQFLPLLLQRNGRIIILSSEVGRQTAAPFNGTYSISKHALEAYADALRRELSFLGLRVIKIQPGAFRTTMTKNTEQLFVEAADKSTYFTKQLSKGISYLPKVYRHANHPALIARKIMRVLESANPPAAVPVKQNTIRTILEWLPAKWADKLFYKVFC
jgi:NAD(P)-dependent dehydrogenase (short-subunit alcohol dehydrogenase family)